MILGMVGWRGMVGSVLMGRMLEENDFAQFSFPRRRQAAKRQMSKALPKFCRMLKMWRRFLSAT